MQDLGDTWLIAILFFYGSMPYDLHMTDDRKPQTADKYIIRFPDGMRDQIAEAARKNGRSMNAEIIQRLEHSFTPWKERPWEERMVIDVDRAMLKLLTKDEYSMLLDRVKAAGGADTVNGYAPTVIRSAEDLKPPIPDGPRLMEMVASLPPPESEKDAIATQLALAVLRLTGKLPEDLHDGPVLVQTSRDALLKPLETVRHIAETGQIRSRTPKIPGQNAPKEGLGAASKEPKVRKPRMTMQKRRVVADDEGKDE